jgi:hypothetical protein
VKLFAAILLIFCVCDVGAQASTAASRSHTDVTFFSNDTVVVHSMDANAALSTKIASYIRDMRPLPGLSRVLRPPARVDLYLARDELDFRDLTRGTAPHWGAGIAFPDSGVIVLPAYTSRRAGVQDLGPVIRHEIAHVQLQRTLQDLRVPRWFTEGYATWTAGQLDPDANWYLRLAFVTQRAPSLDSLELDWPAREADARVAYLLSASAVAYMHSLGPDSLFDVFIARWHDTRSYEEALRKTYLVSSTQFERLWTKHVRRSYGWLLFATQGAVVWMFFTVLVIVLIFMRRRYDRRRLADLRRNEMPDRPAYWMGEEAEEERSQPDDYSTASDAMEPSDAADSDPSRSEASPSEPSSSEPSSSEPSRSEPSRSEPADPEQAG